MEHVTQLLTFSFFPTIQQSDCTKALVRSEMSEQPSPKTASIASADIASDTCCKIVSAIARDAGFTSTYQSSLYALSDVLSLCTSNFVWPFFALAPPCWFLLWIYRYRKAFHYYAHIRWTGKPNQTQFQWYCSRLRRSRTSSARFWGLFEQFKGQGYHLYVHEHTLRWKLFCLVLTIWGG